MKNFLRGHVWSSHTIFGIPALSCFQSIVGKTQNMSHTAIGSVKGLQRVTCVTVSLSLFWFNFNRSMSCKLYAHTHTVTHI